MDIAKYLFVSCVLYLFFTTTMNAQVKIELTDRGDYVEKASAQYKNSNWDAGKRIVDQGLKKYPKDSELRMLSGRYFHEKKQYDKARYDLVKALEYNPQNVDAKQVLVNVEMESKRYSSAICYVNELLEVNPYWKGLWSKKIELYDLQGNTEEANRLRKRLVQIYPEDQNLKNAYNAATEEKVENLNKAGRIDDAIALRKDLLQENPGSASQYIAIIGQLERAGDRYGALSYAERGILQFPGNLLLVNKKTGILASQNRYDEILPFLQSQMARGNATELQRQYNYYLLEAARYSKSQEPATLYGKILDRSPGNEEAFAVVFNDAVGNGQYEHALYILDRHRRARGGSKDLSMKELMLYTRLANHSKVSSLTKQLFAQYPQDADLRANYTKVVYAEASSLMADERWGHAIPAWHQVIQYGDFETKMAAQNALFKAYYNLGDFNNALNLLSELISQNPQDLELYIKRADLYYRLDRYDMALNAYETAITMADPQMRDKYIGGYSDMMTLIVKSLNEEFQLEQALSYTERWLLTDPTNEQALRYAVNLSGEMKETERMLDFATQGKETYPDQVFFSLKVAQEDAKEEENLERVHGELKTKLEVNPYHKDVINTYSEVSNKYANQLIKEKRSEEAVQVVADAVRYSPTNKELLYTKGVGYEKLKIFDSAYAYQSKYQPSLLELSEFKAHMNYLQNRTYKNEIGMYHLRSRFGDEYSIRTISTLEYSRFDPKNTYVGRINYSGREEGKGIQIQGEWSHTINEKTHFKLDATWANQYFPQIAVHGSIYRTLPVLQGLEGELGLGYRKFYSTENLMNLVIGATKEIDPWRLNLRVQNYILDQKYYYNVAGNVRYYLSSPKNYITAVGSVGSSPEVELIDYQLYNGFSVLNTMVGLGFSHLIYRSVTAGALGTWHNFQTTDVNYRNLYNLYMNLNVAF